MKAFIRCLFVTLSLGSLGGCGGGDAGDAQPVMTEADMAKTAEAGGPAPGATPGGAAAGAKK